MGVGVALRLVGCQCGCYASVGVGVTVRGGGGGVDVDMGVGSALVWVNTINDKLPWPLLKSTPTPTYRIVKMKRILFQNFSFPKSE